MNYGCARQHLCKVPLLLMFDNSLPGLMLLRD